MSHITRYVNNNYYNSYIILMWYKAQRYKQLVSIEWHQKKAMSRCLTAWRRYSNCRFAAQEIVNRRRMAYLSHWFAAAKRSQVINNNLYWYISLFFHFTE